MSATITFIIDKEPPLTIHHNSENSVRFQLQDIVKELADKAYAEGEAEIKIIVRTK